MGGGVPGCPVLANNGAESEAYLLEAYCYTDDPIMVTLGRAIGAVITPLISGAAELLVDATVDWGAAWRNAGIRRGEAAQAAK